MDYISNDLTSTPDVPRVDRLTTTHVDVQIYLMAFLYTEDLSSLMRTCRYFLDACLPALCGRANELCFDFELTRLPSFRHFLRIDAGPSSRAHLVKEIRVYAEGAIDSWHTCQCRPHFISLQKEWSAALLDILRHCHNLRRLRTYQWFRKDIPFALFVETISSSLPHLEELTMPMPCDTDAAVLGRLACLPLHSLSFLKYSPMTQAIPDTPHISLDVLPRSLTELDIHQSLHIDAPFAAVKKLGIRDTLLPTFVANATAAFPNVSHIVLRRPDMELTRDVSRNKALLDDARTRNKTQWESSQYRNAWTSVSAIWTEDPTYLYILGFSREVASISVPMGEFVRDSEHFIPQVLADTSPTFLELRIHTEFFRNRLQTDWEPVFGRGSSIRRLTLLLYIRSATHPSCVSYLLECFGAMLTSLPSLTHLLVRFARAPQRLSSMPDAICSIFCSTNTVVHGSILDYLRAFAGIGTSLRWIGYEVFDRGIRSWDISRPSNVGDCVTHSAAAPEDLASGLGHVKMDELSESESLAVAKREGMNAFKEVRGNLLLRS